MFISTCNRLALSVAILGVGALANAITFRESPGSMEFTGELIARPIQPAFKTPSAALQRAATEQMVSPYKVRYYADVDEFILKVPTGMNESTLATQLLASGNFEYVEPNWRVFTQLIPNDPSLNSQWHHNTMESRLAWDITFGSPSAIVAICDTGVRITHEDLAARVVPGYNSVTQLAQTAGGDVSDINGHGTHCAGDAAAVGNNGRGVVGAAGNVSIMPIRVANSGSTSLDNILRGARWAADNGARAISCSWSGVSSSSINTTGTYCRDRNALLFYAAGNDGANLTSFDHANVTVVGASNSADALASFTAFGPGTDVFAPGVSILSTTNSGNNTYGSASGTSMATPVAAGVATLIMSANPNLSAEQVETILEHGSQDMGTAGNDSVWSWGRVNSNRSVRLAQQGKVVYNPATLRFYERVGANLSPLYAGIHSSWRTFNGLSGALASLSTAAEQAFLVSSYTANELQGLTIGGTQGSSTNPLTGWTWNNGETWSYTNWAPGEPNDGLGAETALFIADAQGRWGDMLSSDTLNVDGFLMEYPSTPVNITGTINLEDVPAAVSNVTAQVYWNGTLIQTQNFTNGAFTFSTGLRGNIEIRFSGSHWLGFRGAYTLGSTGLSGINLTLKNGDANGDNEVGPADFTVLSGAFGSMEGDSGFIPGADFNEDDEIGPADFTILSRNFGLQGDD